VRPAEEKAKELADRLGVSYGHYTYHDEEPDLSHLPHREGEWKGGESPTPYKVQTRDGRWITTLPSGIVADYNSVYGGWVIEQIAPNGRTWVSHPYGETRRPSASFIRFMDEILSG